MNNNIAKLFLKPLIEVHVKRLTGKITIYIYMNIIIYMHIANSNIVYDDNIPNTHSIIHLTKYLSIFLIDIVVAFYSFVYYLKI